MKREVVEVCPHCEGENIMQWDVENDGYEATCQHCGKKMMLCDECLHSEDNEAMSCDWSEAGCFRARVVRCKWRDDFTFVCVNADSPNCADVCPMMPCKYAEPEEKDKEETESV